MALIWDSAVSGCQLCKCPSGILEEIGIQESVRRHSYKGTTRNVFRERCCQLRNISELLLPGLIRDVSMTLDKQL